MKLRVVSDYANREVVYTAGRVIDVTETEAAWLMADSPGTFEEEPEKTPAKGAGNAKK